MLRQLCDVLFVLFFLLFFKAFHCVVLFGKCYTLTPHKILVYLSSFKNILNYFYYFINQSVASFLYHFNRYLIRSSCFIVPLWVHCFHYIFPANCLFFQAFIFISLLHLFTLIHLFNILFSPFSPISLCYNNASFS